MRSMRVVHDEPASVPSSTDTVEGLQDSLRTGAVDRRAFLRRVTKLGLSVPAAYALVNAVSGTSFPVKVLAQSLPSPTMISKRQAEMQKILSSPAFLQMLKKLENAPQELRFKLARQIATPQALAKAGVPLTKGMRISTRVFEDPTAAHSYGRSATLAQCVTADSHSTTSRVGFFKKPSPDAVNVCASAGTPGVPVCASVGS